MANLIRITVPVRCPDGRRLLASARMSREAFEGVALRALLAVLLNPYGVTLPAELLPVELTADGDQYALPEMQGTIQPPE